MASMRVAVLMLAVSSLDVVMAARGDACTGDSNNGCGSEYTCYQGNGAGWGIEGQSWAKDSLGDCRAACSANADCLSWQCGAVGTTFDADGACPNCKLNTVREPNADAHANFNFCAKPAESSPTRRRRESTTRRRRESTTRRRRDTGDTRRRRESTTRRRRESTTRRRRESTTRRRRDTGDTRRRRTAEVSSCTSEDLAAAVTCMTNVDMPTGNTYSAYCTYINSYMSCYPGDCCTSSITDTLAAYKAAPYNCDPPTCGAHQSLISMAVLMMVAAVLM